jgi:uncharacterized protein (DUF2147 family)
MASFAVSAVLALAATPASSGSIEGHWMHPEKTVIINLEPCGEAMCGTVTWATERAQRAARKGVDRLIGTRLLTDFQRNAKGVWKGKMFVPDYNMHVNGKIQPLGSDRLKVTGCAFRGLWCKTQLWTRSDKPVASSD